MPSAAGSLRSFASQGRVVRAVRPSGQQRQQQNSSNSRVLPYRQQRQVAASVAAKNASPLPGELVRSGKRVLPASIATRAAGRPVAAGAAATALGTCAKCSLLLVTADVEQALAADLGFDKEFERFKAAAQQVTAHAAEPGTPKSSSAAGPGSQLAWQSPRRLQAAMPQSIPLRPSCRGAPCNAPSLGLPHAPRAATSRRPH
jgi:hypothetical protein